MVWMRNVGRGTGLMMELVAENGADACVPAGRRRDERARRSLAVATVCHATQCSCRRFATVSLLDDSDTFDRTLLHPPIQVATRLPKEGVPLVV